MTVFFIRIFCTMALWLRYRIIHHGRKEILAKGRKGILFLPNHPALIDPVVVQSVILKHFRPRPLVDEKQVRTTVLKYVQKPLGVLAMPDLGVVGRGGKERVMAQIGQCVDALKRGENIMLYPAGHLYRSRYENLKANGAVERILQEYPEVRIVLVRTTGLWGSSFGRCKGYQPSFGGVIKSHIKHILGNFIFFTPRRRVDVELVEAPADFPRQGSRDEINRWLERFYNETSKPNTYVPYGWWEKGTTRVLPEPESLDTLKTDTKSVPADVRAKVMAKLHELSSNAQIKGDDAQLGSDLGLDSLMITELVLWIQDEFGQQVNNPETFRTVGSVLLAAIGASDTIQPLKEIPEKWFIPKTDELMDVKMGESITSMFLENAKRRPDFPLLADQISGVATHRKMILAIMVLQKAISKIPGERIGLIMPACLSCNVVYLAILFSGKTPVMLNWTVGLRNMKHCMKNAEVEHVLTSQTLIERLEGRGIDFTGLKTKFHYLESMVKELSFFSKLECVLASKISWRRLYKAKVPELCAILFTSGSENLPKAVPITHKNILSDTVAAATDFQLTKNEVAIGMLPPFHSFGLLINIVMPDCFGMRVVYHANPLEGDMIARLISAYGATMTIGTPTFIHNILRNANPEAVKTIRIAITGAEKCPQQTYDLIQEKCPNAHLLEGYGITECAPIVSLNKIGHVKIGTLGRVLSCMEWTIRNENLEVVPVGETGMLYVRGDNVFSGYLNYDGERPFVMIDGKEYYRTGDLVSADSEGYISFRGRLKRFVKIAGEMVSLPAIEDVLMKKYREPEGDLPLAVEAQGTEELPVITLFTILDITREEANAAIRDAGLSPIHSIKNVVKLEAIPVLGTGKTDYRTLKNGGMQ